MLTSSQIEFLKKLKITENEDGELVCDISNGTTCEECPVFNVDIFKVIKEYGIPNIPESAQYCVDVALFFRNKSIGFIAKWNENLKED